MLAFIESNPSRTVGLISFSLITSEDAADEMNLAPDVYSTYPGTVVDCLLTAMKLGCKEARGRFARLLQIVEFYPSTMKPFIKMVSYRILAHRHYHVIHPLSEGSSSLYKRKTLTGIMTKYFNTNLYLTKHLNNGHSYI